MKDKVDLFYDLFDQAVMIYYDNLKFNYYESIIAVSKGLVLGEYNSKLSDESVDKLEEIFEIINSENFLNEEVRLALELLIVKAFKHINYNLSLMTPDTINFLIAHVIEKVYPNQEITILDTALGTGNLLNAVNNYLGNDNVLIGVEQDELLIELARCSSDLQNNEIIIYFQDALKELIDTADVIIGDLDSYNLGELSNEFDYSNKMYKAGVRYFPYLNIITRLNNLKDDGYFIYVIDNDFFSYDKNDIFKAELERTSTILSLVVLPSSMFQEGHIGRSIIIGKKEVLNSNELQILEIPSLEKESLQNSIRKFMQMIEKF